ncbi:MAG: NAD-dependent protein deacylase, partial [Promethearchaeota archaeon]
ADVFFVIGSSLVVSPAMHMPEIAKVNGAKLIILNKGVTPLDNWADIRFDNLIEDVLPPIMEKVKKILNKN